MKKLIFITLLCLSSLCFGTENFISLTDLESCQSGQPFTVYMKKGDCEAKGETCYPLIAEETESCSDLDMVEEVFFDHENEILCETEEECSLKFVDFSCPKGERKNSGLSLRCEWESRREKKLANNPAKKAARIAAIKKAEYDLKASADAKKLSRKNAINAAKSIADLKAILLSE